MSYDLNDVNEEIPTIGDWFDSFLFGPTPFTKSWLRFNRPLHEIDGYKVFPVKGNPNGLILVVNTVGIRPEDVSVTCSQSKTLHIVGKTEVEALGESNSVDMSLNINVANPIEKIASKTEDGLTYIYMLFKSKDADSVKVTEIGKEDDFFKIGDGKESKSETKSK
jgi:HSP20 family molecular chaperone IbpA